MKYYIILIFLFITGLVKGQTGYYVEKDYRIARYEDSIISYLITKKQFDINKTPFQVSDYEGKIYVRKYLELFGDSSKSVLLTQFGSLGNATGLYWGLFTQEQFLFFCEVDNSKLQLILKNYDKKTIATLKYYIKLAQSKNRRKRRDEATRTVIDEKNKIAQRFLCKGSVTAFDKRQYKHKLSVVCCPNVPRPATASL